MIVVVALAVPALAGSAAAADDVEVVVDDGDGIGGIGTTETHVFEVGATNVSNATTITLAFPEAFGDDGTGAIGDVTADDVSAANATVTGADADDGTVTVDLAPTGDPLDAIVAVEVTHPTDGAEHGIEASVEEDGAAGTPPSATATLVTHEIDVSFGDDAVGDFADEAATTLTVESVGSGAHATPATVTTRNDALSDETLFRILTGGADADGMATVDDDDLEEAAETDGYDDLDWTWGPDGELGVAGYGDAQDTVVVLGVEPTATGSVTFDVEGVDSPNAYDLEATAVETGAGSSTTIAVEETALSGSFSRERYEAPAGELVELSVDLGGADEGYVVLGGDRLSDPDVPTGYLDVLHVEDGATLTVNTRLIGTSASSEAVYGNDSVVSYAQRYGPDVAAADTETFEGLRFEDADGDPVGDDLSELRSAAATGGIAGPLTPQRYRLTVGTGDAIVVRSDDVVAPERELDRSHLVLTEPEFDGSVTVSTAPRGPATADGSAADLLEHAVERRNVTAGDRLVVSFEATGLGGAMARLAERHPDHEDGREAVYEDGAVRADALEELLTVDEGLSLSAVQTNPGPNERRTRLDLSSASVGDAYVLIDEPNGTDVPDEADVAGAYHLVIDTRGGAFDDALEPGDEFAVELALEGDEGERYLFDRSTGSPPAPFAPESLDDDRVDQQFPYLWPDESGTETSTTFRIREDRIAYDRTVADGDLLVTPDDGTISGNTTLHPATELEAELVSDAGPAPSLSSDEATPGADGNFSVEGNFSDPEPGQRITFELYADGDLYDARPVWVVSDADEPFSFVVENATETVTVTEGESLANLTTIVRNDGDLQGADRLTLDVDDERLTADERVRLRPDRTENVSFDGTTVDLPPGEYPFALSTEVDDAAGTLVVEPADAEEEEDGDEAAEPDESDEEGADADEDEESDADDDVESDEGDEGGDADESDDGDGAGDGEDGDESDDPTPAILPFGTREAIGSTAVVGATYLLGHWV